MPQLKPSLLQAQFSLKSAPTISSTPISKPFYLHGCQLCTDDVSCPTCACYMYHPNSHFLNAVYVVDGGTLPQSMQHAGMFDLICFLPIFAFKSSAKAWFHTHILTVNLISRRYHIVNSDFVYS